MIFVNVIILFYVQKISTLRNVYSACSPLADIENIVICFQYVLNSGRTPWTKLHMCIQFDTMLPLSPVGSVKYI